MQQEEEQEAWVRANASAVLGLVRPLHSVDFTCEKTSSEKPEANSFVATLHRESTRIPWGFLVDASDASGVHVCHLAEGRNAANEYNKAAREEERIQIFDYVIALNDTRLSRRVIGADDDSSAVAARSKAKILSSLFTALNAVITIQRPLIFEARVVRSGEPLGLNIVWTGHGVSFGVISLLDEGSARRSTPPLLAGDRVIAVNGTRGAPDLLRRALREAEDPVVLTVSRRPSALLD